MPFSSGRSVRAPASKATRTVVARVPGDGARWMGRPLASGSELMTGMATIALRLARRRCNAPLHAAASPGAGRRIGG